MLQTLGLWLKTLIPMHSIWQVCLELSQTWMESGVSEDAVSGHIQVRPYSFQSFLPHLWVPAPNTMPTSTATDLRVNQLSRMQRAHVLL